MVRKYDTISMLAEDTSKNIVRNGDAWMTYLTTAGSACCKMKLYIYRFTLR